MKLDESDIESWFEDQKEKLTKEYNRKTKLLFDTTGDFAAEEEAAKKKKNTFENEEEEAPRPKKPQMTDDQLAKANETRETYKKEYEAKIIALRKEYDARYSRLWATQRSRKKRKERIKIFIIGPFLLLWKGISFIFRMIGKLKPLSVKVINAFHMRIGLKIGTFFYRIFKVHISLSMFRYKRWHAKKIMPYTEVYMRPSRRMVRGGAKFFTKSKDFVKKTIKSIIEDLQKLLKSVLEKLMKPLKAVMKGVTGGVKGVTDRVKKTKDKYKEMKTKVFGGGGDEFS